MTCSTIARRVATFTLIPATLVLSAQPASAAIDLEAASASSESAIAHPRVAAPNAVLAPRMSSARRTFRLTWSSPQTRDMRGVEPSMYRGRFYRPTVEVKRRCIAQRESEGHYDVVSHNGYYGAYQMSPALARGATWMMLPEHKALLGDLLARRLMWKLRHIPLNTWPRYWQDAAFSTIFNHEYRGSGAAHWAGG